MAILDQTKGPSSPVFCLPTVLMNDPMLREKKFLKSVLSILEERSHDRNSIVREMAVRGLGNLVYGALEKKHKKFLMVILTRALNDTPEVIGESMKALAKVLKELKEKDIGSSFRDLTQKIRTYFDNEDDALCSKAFVLFGILARLTKRKWKTYFADQVKQSWVTLLLHLQDPNPEVSMPPAFTTHNPGFSRPILKPLSYPFTLLFVCPMMDKHYYNYLCSYTILHF
uniref:Maestro/Maestro-like HEAT-repeats domain-containing protein n=1 Tax=Chrysemys picta bellii TaxID=8478 RepID=A0A8C3P856_CHRPI